MLSVTILISLLSVGRYFFSHCIRLFIHKCSCIYVIDCHYNVIGCHHLVICIIPNTLAPLLL